MRNINCVWHILSAQTRLFPTNCTTLLLLHVSVANRCCLQGTTTVEDICTMLYRW